MGMVLLNTPHRELLASCFTFTPPTDTIIPKGPIAVAKEVGQPVADAINRVAEQADQEAGSSERQQPTEPHANGQFSDLLNLIRQAAAASERTQQAAKYAEMS